MSGVLKSDVILGIVSLESLLVLIGWEETLLHLPYTRLLRTTSCSGEIDKTLRKKSRSRGVLLFLIRFCFVNSEIIVSINLDLSLTEIAFKSARFLFFLILSMEFKILDLMAEY